MRILMKNYEINKCQNGFFDESYVFMTFVDSCRSDTVSAKTFKLIWKKSFGWVSVAECAIHRGVVLRNKKDVNKK